MSSLFGGGAREAQREAKKQQGEARAMKQTSNEEAGRAQQLAERGGAGGGSRGRDMLMGALSRRLKDTLGG